MEASKNESDTFWGTSQKGFDFDDSDAQGHGSKLSTVMRKNDDLNQFDLLINDGLTEIAENKTTRGCSSAFDISYYENEMCLSKLAKKFNPLEMHQKIPSNIIGCGPDETIINMVLGFEYSLAKYKGKKEKTDLLSAAVKSHAGNIILEVVLFLRDTLKKSIFQREIVAHPDAVNVYLAYLEEDHETDELANMFLLLDKAEDAAIFKYEAAITVQHPERKLKWIENCLSTHFQPGATDVFLRQSVEEHKQLLCEQIKLEEHFLSCYPNEIKILLQFEKLCGRQSVVDSSVLCSLIFCYLYFHKSNELNFTSPDKIKSNYNLSKKQYTWTSLRALAASNKWSDVDGLFTSKNWLGGIKFRSCIAFTRIIEVIFKENAPNEVLCKYISCVENDHEKLLLAKKYGCHSIALEVFKNNKDRLGLIKYQSSLVPHSVDFCNALDILNTSNVRWKN